MLSQIHSPSLRSNETRWSYVRWHGYSRLTYSLEVLMLMAFKRLSSLLDDLVLDERSYFRHGEAGYDLGMSCLRWDLANHSPWSERRVWGERDTAGATQQRSGSSRSTSPAEQRVQLLYTTSATDAPFPAASLVLLRCYSRRNKRLMTSQSTKILNRHHRRLVKNKKYQHIIAALQIIGHLHKLNTLK